MLERGLGLASLALGVPQTAMPGRFARFIGVRDDDDSRAWTRAVGIRELVAAAGILVVEWPRPMASLWARVAGDAMDLALLGRALTSKSKDESRTIGAIAAVAGITLADLFAAVRMSRAGGGPEDGGTRVTGAVTVRRPREEVYVFWQDFENLPLFMAHLDAVVVIADGRSHWTARTPGGRTVEWDAEVVEYIPNEVIAWRSLKGGDVESAGLVRFTTAPGGRGTEIRLEMQYGVPGGVVGRAVAKLFGEDPEQQINDDLRRFKQVSETGIVVRSEGSPEGPDARRLLKQRPAQPLPAGAGDGRAS